MSHTPLARALRRLYAEHRAARALGLPPGALRERRAEPGATERAERNRAAALTRRELLRGAAAAALAAAAPALARGSGSERGPRVAIVGAGLAGLCCAAELARLGVRATVYEASGRVGGRVFSARRAFAAGQVAEWGGELIDSGHETVIGLAGALGLELDDLLAAQAPGAQDTYFFRDAYYPQAQADLDFAPVFAAVSADAEAAPFPTLHEAHTPAAAALDRLSVREWIESRVPGGFGAPLGQLLDTAYAVEFGADPRAQSALNLVYLLAFQPEPERLAAFGESDEALRVRGGNQQLAERLAAQLGPGCVELGQCLLRIAETPAGRFRLVFERGGAAREQLADHVVLALPFAVLRELDLSRLRLDARKRRAIAQLGRGRNTKLSAQFRERLWARPGPWPGAASSGSSYTDTGYEASWEATRAQPGAPGILVFYGSGSPGGAGAGSGPAFASAGQAQVRRALAQALAAAEPVFPGLAARALGPAALSVPARSALFRASYSFYRPGQYTDFGGHERAPQGNLFFCGEHTSVEFQGFMEGAAQSGQRAARELATRLGAGAAPRREIPSAGS